MYYPYCSDKDYFKHVYTLILCIFREGNYIYVKFVYCSDKDYFYILNYIHLNKNLSSNLSSGHNNIIIRVWVVGLVI